MKSFLDHVFEINYQQCLDQLDAIQAKPTPQQLARLASATRMLLALHPVNDDGSCRICTPWWRSPRRICTIYAAFAHPRPENHHDPPPDTSVAAPGRPAAHDRGRAQAPH